MTSAESIELTTQVAELAKAGLPLAAGLRAMQADLPGGRLSKAVDMLVGWVEAGTPVDVALGRTAAWLPPHLRGMLAAGVHSGRMAAVLQESLAYEQLQAESGRRMASVMAYPVMIFTLFLAWVAFVLFAVVPQFVEVFNDFGVQLHPATQVLVWFCGPAKWLLIVPLAAIDLAPLLLRSFSHTYCASWILSRLPLVGTAWKARSLVGFCNLLATLLEQSIPLPAALQLAADGVVDGELRAACRDAAVQTAAGVSLSKTMAALPAFPHTLVPIVRWGEETSALSGALRSAGSLYLDRLEVQTQLLSLVIPPATFVIILAASCFVVGAIMLPLVKLVTALSG